MARVRKTKIRRAKVGHHNLFRDTRRKNKFRIKKQQRFWHRLHAFNRCELLPSPGPMSSQSLAVISPDARVALIRRAASTTIDDSRGSKLRTRRFPHFVMTWPRRRQQSNSERKAWNAAEKGAQLQNEESQARSTNCYDRRAAVARAVRTKEAGVQRALEEMRQLRTPDVGQKGEKMLLLLLPLRQARAKQNPPAITTAAASQWEVYLDILL